MNFSQICDMEALQNANDARLEIPSLVLPVPTVAVGALTFLHHSKGTPECTPRGTPIQLTYRSMVSSVRQVGLPLKLVDMC